MLKPGALLQGFVPRVDLTIKPAEVVAGMNPAELVITEAWSAPATTVTMRPPEVVTGPIPLDEPTRLTAVLPDAAPPRIVTPRPPEVVTGATPEEVPTILTRGVPLI